MKHSDLTTSKRLVIHNTRSHGPEAALAGGIAGSVAKTITAPLSRLTILYQVNNALPPSQRISIIGSSDSMLSLTSHILKTEGFSALWKGNLTSVIHRFPYSAINFATYEICQSVLKRTSLDVETPSSRFLCGAVAGGSACFAVYPLDLIRTRLTINNNDPDPTKSKRSIIGTFQSILKKDGIAGLYRGLSMSLLVCIPTFAVGFSIYGTLKQQVFRLDSSIPYVNKLLKREASSENNEPTLTPLASMLLGAVSGIASSLITFPADVIRRRIQVRGLSDNTSTSSSSISVCPPNSSSSQYGGYESTLNPLKRYSDAMHPHPHTHPHPSPALSSSSHYHSSTAATPSAMIEFKEVVRSQGYRGLYRGIAPEILKVTPMVAITFSVYEYLRGYFHNSFSN